MIVNWIVVNIIVFVCVVIITGVIIPKILLVAFRKNLFDDVDARKIHKGTIPRLGGIAFFPAILFSLFLVIGLLSFKEPVPITDLIEYNYQSFSFIICSVVILYLVGIADDLIGVKYKAKFCAQILAASLIILGGLYIDNLHGFLWINVIPSFLSFLLTILIVVFIINSINLIDGIDGLASGLSGIACCFYGIIFYQIDLFFYSMLSFATFGTLVPFFCYNVFGNAKKHSKIFMGDTGSLTIGLILSVLSIKICMIKSIPDTTNPIIGAFAPLIIPCFDVVRVYLRRVRYHKNPFLPDKTHIHHKLLALGIKQQIAMPVIILYSLILTVFNYVVVSYWDINLLFIFNLALWIVINVFLSYMISKREII